MLRPWRSLPIVDENGNHLMNTKRCLDFAVRFNLASDEVGMICRFADRIGYYIDGCYQIDYPLCGYNCPYSMYCLHNLCEAITPLLGGPSLEPSVPEGAPRLRILIFNDVFLTNFVLVCSLIKLKKVENVSIIFLSSSRICNFLKIFIQQTTWLLHQIGTYPKFLEIHCISAR